MAERSNSKESSDSLTASPIAFKKKNLMSSFNQNHSPKSSDSPPETPGLAKRSKLSIGALSMNKPKINVNVSNNYPELATVSNQKRGLKTDI